MSTPDLAPDASFTRPDGSMVRLSQLLGQKVLVLYFYPKDDTPGCTTEACTFRDQYEDFTQAGAEVIGVSADGGQSHDAFKQKYRLPFMLLSDPGGEAAKAFGVTKKLGLFAGRVTFVIDRSGTIRHRFDSQVRVQQHVREALEVVRTVASEKRA